MLEITQALNPPILRTRASTKNQWTFPFADVHHWIIVDKIYNSLRPGIPSWLDSLLTSFVVSLNQTSQVVPVVTDNVFVAW